MKKILAVKTLQFLHPARTPNMELHVAMSNNGPLGHGSGGAVVNSFYMLCHHFVNVPYILPQKGWLIILKDDTRSQGLIDMAIELCQTCKMHY